jgi:uncharacterized coiled-coil DUF342 family protein
MSNMSAANWIISGLDETNSMKQCIKRQTTRDKRQLRDKRQTTRDKRQETNDKRRTTRDERQETNDKRQETRDKQRTNQTIVLRIQSDEMLQFGTGLLRDEREPEEYKQSQLSYLWKDVGQHLLS